jgi:hypothetical protein
MFNLYAGWIGIFLGLCAGAVEGLFFHEESWRGGYGSWRRRMVRLGHISFFGIGFINLAYALSLAPLGIDNPAVLPSILLVAGAAGMPLVCYLSAYRKPFRHLFFIPAGSVIWGVALFLFREVFR